MPDREAVMPKRVALLGAGGQVGRYLMEYLSADPRLRVLGICRNAVTAGPLRLAGLEVKCAQVSDPETAREELSDHDVIVNLTAASGTGIAAEARAQDRAVLRALVDLPRSPRLIHFSSVGVYGTCCVNTLSTFERPRPDWPFGREKLQLETYFRRLLDERGLTAVTVRLGHVYGVGQWVSRQVIELSGQPQWRLPFGGRYPSNAVHVRNVAAAVRSLIFEVRPGKTLNLVDSPASTWRDVFDWTTDAVGHTPVPAMDESESARWRHHHRREASRSVWRKAGEEAIRWARGLPAGFIMACPSVRGAGAALLDSLNLPGVASRAQMRVNRLRFGAVESVEPPASHLFSDPVPGPVVPYEGERCAADESALARWYRDLTDPDSLRQGIENSSTVAALAGADRL